MGMVLAWKTLIDWQSLKSQAWKFDWFEKKLKRQKGGRVQRKSSFKNQLINSYLLQSIGIDSKRNFYDIKLRIIRNLEGSGWSIIMHLEQNFVLIWKIPNFTMFQ